MSDKWVLIWDATVFIRIFETNGRFDIGRKLLKLLGSAPGFFSMGVMAADLKSEGTRPEVREECMMTVIREDNEGRQAFTRGVGRGSN